MSYDPTLAEPLRQGTRVTVPPVGHPLSLADAKLHLRIESDDTWQDDQIDLLCGAVHRKLETDLGFPVLRQTRRTALDGFPAGGDRAIWIGGGDDPAISSFTWLDSTATPQPLTAGTHYVLDAISSPARVVPIPGTSWPSPLRRPGAVVIDWTAGWAMAAAVPEDLMHAQKLLLGHWFENREAVLAGTIASEVPLGYQALVEGWRSRALY